MVNVSFHKVANLNFLYTLISVAADHSSILKGYVRIYQFGSKFRHSFNTWSDLLNNSRIKSSVKALYNLHIWEAS